MKTNLTIATAMACAVLFSCKDKINEPGSVPQVKKYAELEKAGWLIGKWGFNSSEGNLSENWVKVNDSVYNGESYFVIGKDTVFAETVVLAEANGVLAYTVTVPGQNEEKPVRFAMTSGNGSEMVFENPAHDFPSKITYKKISNDSLVAEISGKKNGKAASEMFPMGRFE